MSSITDSIPDRYRRLLDVPIYGALGTIRPDDTVQVNPMWFAFDGSLVRFTHTTRRQKFRNLQHNPSMSLSLIDPESPFRYLEVAGHLVDTIADPTAAFYLELQTRYGFPNGPAPADAADRVILVMSVERFTTQ